MREEDGYFAVIGLRGAFGSVRPTNMGPYLVSFKLAAGESTLWGNRVINFGLSPDVEPVRVDEVIPLLEKASRMTLLGLTDLTIISRYEGPLRVRFHTVACTIPNETHEFRVTGPRRMESGADIKALEFELTRYTGYNGITIIDISMVEG